MNGLLVLLHPVTASIEPVSLDMQKGQNEEEIVEEG